MQLQRSLFNYKRIYSSECNNVNMQLTLGVEAMITKNALQVLCVFKLDQNQAINKKLLLGK